MEDDRKSLDDNYREFKKCLRDGSFPKYDELDLIEIFDVAGDNNDYYVQTEVLMLGARLFPESEELLQRRGFLYSKINTLALSNFIDNNPQFDGVCWDLLRLKDYGLEGRDAEPMLDEIVKKYKRFNDEDIIRLSELVREQKCEEWFIKNVDTLEKKAEYGDTLLYEVAFTQHDSGDYDGAIITLDKLTKIDPFRAENWILLADSYLNSGQYAEGLKAIEFARAVETDIPEADSVEASLLLALEKDLPRAIALYEKYLTFNPLASNVIHNLSMAYQKIGEPERCHRYLSELFMLCPSNPSVLKELIALSPASTKELLSFYLEHNGDDSDLLDLIGEIIKDFLFAGDFNSAIMLGRSIPDIVSKMGIVEYYLWAIMLANDWQGLIDFYNQLDDNEFFNHDSESLFYIAFAYLNVGRYDDAKDIAVRGLECINKTFNTHLSFRMNQYGCQQALSTLIKLVDYGQADMIERFDPLLVKGKD